MNAPYIIEDQIAGHDWYTVSAEYATAYMAKQTFERIQRRMPIGSVGIYRHGFEGDEAKLITAVSMDLDQIRRVAGFLRVGQHFPIDEETRLGLIARRARVVTEAQARGQQSGRLKWRRPEKKGARLDPRTGEMIEHEPGEG